MVTSKTQQIKDFMELQVLKYIFGTSFRYIRNLARMHSSKGGGGGGGRGDLTKKSQEREGWKIC